MDFRLPKWVQATQWNIRVPYSFLNLHVLNIKKCLYVRNIEGGGI